MHLCCHQSKVWLFHQVYLNSIQIGAKQTTNVTEIKIMPNNQRFKLLDNKCIIAKSTPESENYDILVFACRDIESFIKHIAPSAFYYCRKIKQILIPNDSELQTIGDYAFQF